MNTKQRLTLPQVSACSAPLLAFCVVVLGAWVRLSDAGLGCPDWPGCYGQLTAGQAAENAAPRTRRSPSDRSSTRRRSRR